jgi:hypothetical protein
VRLVVVQLPEHDAAQAMVEPILHGNAWKIFQLARKTEVLSQATWAR